MTSLRLAYLINQYPKVSHSFIRTEILELERQGHRVLRIAMRGWDGELADPADHRERAATRYVLKSGAAPVALAALRTAFTRPGRFLAALRLAIRTGRGSERGLLVNLIYLAEACVVLGWLRAAAVEHVHAHFGSNAAAVAMLVRALGGPPYSFTVHGPEEFDKPLQLKLRDKARYAGGVVAITSFCRGQLYRWLDRRDWGKVAEVRCGLDANFLDAGASDYPAAPRLVCVGRLCEQKAQLLLVEACAMLARRGVAFDLALAGDGEMRPEIEALIAAAKLGERVRITGWLSGEQVRAELIAARALVLPSFAEGLPVVIMEAMAMRRPVITTYVAGIPELVRDGIEGLLIPSGDADALADAIERFLDLGRDEAIAMGERAHARVRERHAIGGQAARLAAMMEATRDRS